MALHSIRVLFATPLLLFGATSCVAATPVQQDDGRAATSRNAGHGYAASAFGNNTRYPKEARVDLVDTEVAPGSDTASIGVRLSGPSPNTVIAFVRCYNGSGALPVRDRTQTVIFRPGDPLATSVSCAVRSADAGDTIRFAQANAPDGAARGRNVGVARVTPNPERASFPPSSAFRKPGRFAPAGTLRYEARGADLRFSDAPDADAWSTALPHGRTQPGNAETGYYGPATMGGFEKRGRDLALVTRRLRTPIEVAKEQRRYPFLAANLSGHMLKATHFQYGSVEIEAKMPDRRGSWPALWLLPTTGWPPEIDIYEGFTYNPEWHPEASLSTNLHGGKDIKRTFTRPAFRMRMQDFGLEPTLTSAFHRFQVTVDPQWITMFVDDVETMRYANGFAGTTWFPLMNVGVKIAADDAYAAGSGTMEIRRVRIWRDVQGSSASNP